MTTTTEASTEAIRAEMARIERDGLNAAHRLLRSAAATADWPPASAGFQARAREQAVAQLLTTHTQLAALDASLRVGAA